MATENITISKASLLKAYREAEPSQQEFLKKLFGADKFAISFNVMDRVKTFQDAINELGYEHPLVRQFVCVCNSANNSGVKLDADIIAYLKLRIIAAALNEGWESQFTKGEWRYYPFFYVLTKEEYDKLSAEEKRRCVGRSYVNANVGGGLVFASTNYGSAHSHTNGGVRLAFKTRELAEYAAKQFLNIWVDFVYKIRDTNKSKEV